MSTTLRSALLAALALCACRSGGGGAGPVDVPLPQAERKDGLVVVCVVDARSGLPIPGARVAAVPELHTPQPRTWWEASSSTSDADGIARLDLTGLADDPWLIATAEGYAPRAQLARDPGPRLELVPAQTLEVEVRDVFEEPVEGAWASWFVGCGHTPDMAWAQTSADGRALLTGVDRDPSAGDLWIAGPTLATDYGFAPEFGSALVRVEPGVAARGQVVDAEGLPRAGVYVGVPVRHHGPWTRTAADGSFELPGTVPPAEVQVLSEPDSQAWLGGFELPDDGREVTLTAPPDDDPRTNPVELRMRWDQGLVSLEGLAVEFVRLADGFTVRARSDDSGNVTLGLPLGAWQRTIGGGASGWKRSERRFTLADEPFVETITLEAQPRWSFTLAEPHPDARVELVWDLGVRPLEGGELEGAPVPVPVGGRCAVRVELHDRVRVLELPLVDRRQPGTRELALPEPLQVRARLLDAERKDVQGTLWVGDGAPPAWPEGRDQPARMPRTTTWQADADLWVLPADERLAPRRLARALPWEGRGLDVGEVLVEPFGARSVRVLDADGSPLAGARVRHHAALGLHAPELDAEGAFESPAFPAAAGDALVVRPADGGPTFHAVLEGAGPWSVSRPDTRVVLEVVDALGEPVPEFAVSVAGEVFAGRAGRLELVGLDARAQVAFVSAPGSVPWRVPFEPTEGGALELRVVLAAR